MPESKKPFKYHALIRDLDDDTPYSASMIAQRSKGETAIKLRIRISLGRLKHRSNFPREGDGVVDIRGQAPYPAWFGWRWKVASEGKQVTDKKSQQPEKDMEP